MKHISIHILTLNNEKTIVKAIESVLLSDTEIIIGDLGSTDKTLKICKSYNLNIINLDYKRRDDARNFLIKESLTDWQFYLEPYEFIKSGWENIVLDKTAGCFIQQSNIINKSCRLWNKKHNLKFINPVFEHLDIKNYKVLDCIIASSGNNISEKIIDDWIKENPILSVPYYYKAMINIRNYKEFINISDKYLFYEKQKKLALIMIRYHRSYANFKLKEYKKAVDEIQYCLSEKPEMAEFWCMLGDIIYAVQDFKQALTFYEKALLCKRDIRDNFPVIPEKYKKYPLEKIKMCEKLLKETRTYTVG